MKTLTGVSLIAIILIFTSQCFAEIDPETAIGIWLFDEGGGDVASDSSGNGNDGIIENAKWVDGKFEKALEFNGKSACVKTEKKLLGKLEEFTIMLWAKPGDIVANRVGLVGQNDSVEFGFINPNTVQLWHPSFGGDNAPYNYPKNEWHHIAGVGSKDSSAVYIDGEVAVKGGPYITQDSGFNVNIGGCGVYDPTGNWFTGIIDDVAIFHVALSKEDIAKIMKTKVTLVIIFILSVITILVGQIDIAKSQAVEEGLVSYWSFDKVDIEGDTVKDLWGNNDGTLKGAPKPVEGKVREALEFDGGRDYVNFGDDASLRIDRPLTIEFWFKTNRDTLDDNIIALTDGNTTDYIISSYQNPDRLSFTREDPADANYQLNGSTAIDKSWHHVATVDDGKRFYLYLDGKLDSSQNFSFKPYTQAGTLYIAYSPEDWSTNARFKGLIDEVRVYKKALSENEVNQNMNAEGLDVTSSTDKLPLIWGKIKVLK